MPLQQHFRPSGLRAPLGMLAIGTLLCAMTVPLFLATAEAQNIEVGVRYRQSAPVLARYPDLDLRLDTPALQAGRQTLTTQTELESFLSDLLRPGAPVARTVLAETTQKRQIPLLFFSKEGLTDPAALARLGRPIVWLIGQQHGNEPAGGEAMLAVAKALAEGELKPLLSSLVIAMVPRANPDGAAAEKRDTASGMDMNRDHATLSLPEVRALHRAMQVLPPDLAIDAHEFSVAARWVQKFGALQAVDLMLLSATHPMAPDATRALADTVFEPAMVKAAHAHGLKTFAYHTTSTRRDDTAVSMGGNAPGISRNALGLSGAVAFLLETRGVGIGMESFQRRVATHYIAIRAALETAAREASLLRDTVLAARQQLANDTRTLIVAHKVGASPLELPLIDPETGADKIVPVTFSNSRQISILEQRQRAAAYILPPSSDQALDRLAALGARTCRLSAPLETELDVLTVTDRGQANRRAINPNQSIKGTLARRPVAVPAGSIIVPMAQPSSARIAAVLEPDAPGGFLGLDVIPLPAEAQVAPIMRLPAGATVQFRDGETCAIDRTP
jgi:hypothetical protein